MMTDLSELLVGGLTLSTDDRGRLHFWGEVFNLGKLTQRWIKVTIRLLDDRGRVAAEQGDIAGLEWTLPGARNPFYIRFLTPPERWFSYDIRLEATTHDYQDLTLPQPHPGVIAAKLHFREIGRADLRCSIVGQLANMSVAGATHVKVAGTLYGPDGKVVGVLSPYLVPRGIFAPGDALTFELKFYALAGPVANYSVQAQGRMVQG
jgi:hypothetical protein